MPPNFNATENNATEESSLNIIAPEQESASFKAKKWLIEFVLFFIFAYCFIRLTSKWFTFACYLQFLDALQVQSTVFSGIFGSLFVFCIFSLYLPFPSEKFPRLFLAIALFLNALATGTLVGIHQMAPSMGNYGGVLLGGFIGFLASIPLLIYLGFAFDEVDSFKTSINALFTIFGMFIFIGILGELITKYPQTFGSLKFLLGKGGLFLGGVLGYGLSFLLTFFLEEERINYAFKLLFFAFFAGQSAQIAYQAFQHLLK